MSGVPGTAEPLYDFFVSYTSQDRVWAEWIAQTLEDAKYKTIIQARDFRPGQNFVARMHHALIDARKTIAVLSAGYLASIFAEDEWTAAFAERRLLAVRVKPVALTGLFRTIVYADLVGLGEEAARTALLQALQPPTVPAVVPFPGGTGDRPNPGAPLTDAALDEQAAARELLSILETSRTTFLAQVRLRDQLVEEMTQRLGIATRYQFEEFFDRFYPLMNEKERRTHAIIRSYTELVLREYNQRALDLVVRFPALEQTVPGVGRLRSHLVVWMAKYRAVFEKTESMSLVYVGVDEAVPFPTGLEDVLRRYIDTVAAGRVFDEPDA